jgi:hypothetical protein
MLKAGDDAEGPISTAFVLAPSRRWQKDKAVEIFPGSANVSPVPDELERRARLAPAVGVPPGAPKTAGRQTSVRPRTWPWELEERALC